VRTLEVRRHATRDPTEDRLSERGREQARSVGATLAGGYAVVFVSPARRAAETVAWFLRGLGEQLPAHEVVPGLGAKDNDGSPAAMAGVISALLDAVPEGALGLAVSHTPLIERAVLGLVGRPIDTLGECEGVLLTRADDEATVEVQELRLR
jgi:phosphohistidine phosphatase SixA